MGPFLELFPSASLPSCSPPTLTLVTQMALRLKIYSGIMFQNLLHVIQEVIEDAQEDLGGLENVWLAWVFEWNLDT